MVSIESQLASIEVVQKRMEKKLFEIDRRLDDLGVILEQLVRTLAELSDAQPVRSQPVIHETVASSPKSRNDIEALQVLVRLNRPARCTEVQSLMTSVDPAEGRGYNTAQRALQKFRTLGFVTYRPGDKINYSTYEINEAGREYLERGSDISS